MPSQPPSPSYSTSMCLSGTDVLGPEEDRICPIELEEFEKLASSSAGEERVCCILDFVPPGTCFVPEHPELCVGTLRECGHRFSPMAIVYHMCLSGMQCPVCRYRLFHFHQQHLFVNNFFPPPKILLQVGGQEAAAQLRLRATAPASHLPGEDILYAKEGRRGHDRGRCRACTVHHHRLNAECTLLRRSRGCAEHHCISICCRFFCCLASSSFFRCETSPATTATRS